MTDKTSSDNQEIGFLEEAIRKQAVADVKNYFARGLSNLCDQAPLRILAWDARMHKYFQDMRYKALQYIEDNADVIGDRALRAFLEDHNNMAAEFEALKASVEDLESRARN